LKPVINGKINNTQYPNLNKGNNFLGMGINREESISLMERNVSNYKTKGIF